MSLVLNKQTSQCNMLIGDFSLIVRSKNFEVIMNTFDLECLITKSKCSQSAHPNYIDIDLILATTTTKKKNQKLRCFRGFRERLRIRTGAGSEPQK